MVHRAVELVPMATQLRLVVRGLSAQAAHLLDQDARVVRRDERHDVRL
jgi:hypothetical protein